METRETALFRATGKREHEAARGRMAPANRPKTPKFGLPRKYHRAEKTDLEKIALGTPWGSMLYGARKDSPV